MTRYPEKIHSERDSDGTDLQHLRRCLQLAEEALKAGDGPFGSVLVGADGALLAEDRNRTVSTGDPTAHPEFTLAQWAARNLGEEERGMATVYTSGEHCPMCSATHAWVGIGRIVYIASSAQLSAWRAEWGWSDAPVRSLSIHEVAPDVRVDGPVPELLDQIRGLHARRTNDLFPDGAVPEVRRTST